MTNNVYYLHSQPPEIARYIRVGFNEHRRCEHLLTAGKMGPSRYVIEAGGFERHASLVSALIDQRSEIVLDTNAAELSVPGKYLGSASRAPWARATGPLEVDDFVAPAERSVIEMIARFAVESRVSAVMTPSHFLGDTTIDWFDVDRRACIALREELDRYGAKRISIDYPLILTYAQLRDGDFRTRLVDGLRSVPFDHLWLRVSGFGADAEPTKIARYIRDTYAFQELGRPVIADHVGGLAALAATAFGAVSGFAHGLEGKERFNAYSWSKPRASGDGFGRPKSVYLPSLDRRLSVSAARELFDGARHSRTLLGCREPGCCGDIETMLRSPESHSVVTMNRHIGELSGTPTSQRPIQLLGTLVEARQQAEQATRLKKVADSTKAKITKARDRLNRLGETLIHLERELGSREFASEARGRSSDPRRVETATVGVGHE
jgi:hypothetical protein